MKCSETEALYYNLCSMNKSGNGGLCATTVCKVKLMMSVDSHLLVFVTGVRRVGGIDIYTPKEVEAVNGTDVKLKCTFTSTQPVSIQSVTVSWNFRPMNSGSDESVCSNCVFMKML